MPQKRMECFRLLFDHLAWIEHEYLSGIRDSRNAGSLWGMMRGVGGVSWCIDRTLLSATTPSRSGPGSDGNEGVLCILQSSSITEASPSDCLVSYAGHLLGESYPSAETQSVYSAARREIYVYKYIYIHINNTEKNMQTCPNRWNMQI